MNNPALQFTETIEIDATDHWQELLMPLLHALKWKGHERHLFEALSLPGAWDMERFRDVVVHLGYASQEKHDNPHALMEDMLPAIVVDTQGLPHLIVHSQDTTLFQETFATLLLFTPVFVQPTQEASPAGLKTQLARFRPILSHVILLSLLIGIISLAPAWFNMAIYDRIIGSGSTKGLFMLSVGVLMALSAELFMRHLRNKRLALFGARIDHYVSCSVFERLMFLPPHYTGRASVSSQLARLRDFEAVREFFTGPLAALFFEIPLVGIYVIAMAVVGGWMAAVPLALLIAYGLLILFMNNRIKESGKIAASTSTKRQEFLLETVTHLRAIRLAGMEDVWQKRGRQLSAHAADASFRAGFHAQILETASYILMTIGGITTLAFGVHAVIAGSLSVGNLIASMMLIWRIVAPLQVACASITRIQQLAASTNQVQHLLSVLPEHLAYATPVAPDIKGHVAFHRVSLRYAPDAEPALLGVSFEIKPGQIIAIRGGNGCGKSTLLKVLLGMYPPQSGSVQIDGVDIRQFDPIALRQNISYVPQAVDFFPGSLRDNLQLANPAAQTEDRVWALQEACTFEEIMRLPQCLDTIIAGPGAEPIPFLLRHRLNLARAYIKRAPIMLFDEGSYSLGKENEQAFIKKIGQLRGNTTVLMITHREDHMRLADVLLVMNKGELTHMGPPDQVLNVLKGKK